MGGCGLGVSHLTVPSDVEGVQAICEWMSYVPRKRYSPVPILSTMDPVNRPIKYHPTKAPYDPRNMLAGRFVGGKCFLKLLLFFN